MNGKDHLNENQESYWEHAQFGIVQGCRLLLAALASFIHAVFPGILIGYSADVVKYLHSLIVLRDKPSER